MWVEANEDQCCWWLGTTTCTQTAVHALTPFLILSLHAHTPPPPPPLSQGEIISPSPPLVCDEPYLSLVFSLVLVLALVFHFCLFSLHFSQWVEFAVLFVCACYVLQLLNGCFLKLSFLLFILFIYFFNMHICHGFLCYVLSCFVLFCLPFSLTVILIYIYIYI